MNAQSGAGCPQGEEPGGEDRKERDRGQAEQYLGPQAKPAPALSVVQDDAFAGHASAHDSTAAASRRFGAGWKPGGWPESGQAGAWRPGPEPAHRIRLPAAGSGPTRERPN